MYERRYIYWNTVSCCDWWWKIQICHGLRSNVIFCPIVSLLIFPRKVSDVPIGTLINYLRITIWKEKPVCGRLAIHAYTVYTVDSSNIAQKGLVLLPISACVCISLCFFTVTCDSLFEFILEWMNVNIIFGRHAEGWEGGDKGQLQNGEGQPIIWPLFPEDCTKMKTNELNPQSTNYKKRLLGPLKSTKGSLGPEAHWCHV